jgi:hypothetical protein
VDPPRRAPPAQSIDSEVARGQARRSGFGILVYALAVGVSFISAPWTLAMHGAVAVYYVVDQLPRGAEADAESEPRSIAGVSGRKPRADGIAVADLVVGRGLHVDRDAEVEQLHRHAERHDLVALPTVHREELAANSALVVDPHVGRELVHAELGERLDPLARVAG